jgi:RHS repeat-associated protein
MMYDPVEQPTYAYDAIGNIINRSDVGTYTYAGTNYANPHAATSIGTSTQTYDNNGNLTSDGTWTNNWNYKNQLTLSGNGTASSTYSYDENGSRVKLTEGGTTTYYPNRYYSIEGATSTSYIFAGDTLVAYVEGNGNSTSTYFVHPDHLGSTNAITDSLGQTSLVKDYRPFGFTRIEEGSASLKRGFIGQFEDANLVYLNARYQNPVQGRFISQDPTFLAIGNPLQVTQLNKQQQKQLLADPQSLNSYSYARGNPIVNRDTSGLCFEPLSAIGCVYAVYTGATLLIDAYDVYQTNFQYGNVFSQEEKNRTNFKAGYDIALIVTGAKIKRDVGKIAEVGFDTLSAGVDVMDTYFGEQINKNYNESQDTKKKKGAQASNMQSSRNNNSSNIQANNPYTPHQTSQYSTPNQNGGGLYSQLSNSLGQLVASLQAYVSGLPLKK